MRRSHVRGRHILFVAVCCAITLAWSWLPSTRVPMDTGGDHESSPQASAAPSYCRLPALFDAPKVGLFELRRRADDRLPQQLSRSWESSSQLGEDLFLIDRFFYGMRGGVFVELGALDGVRGSNTRLLERALAWRGVLIEADPVTAAALPHNRPQAHAVHAAVCSKSETVHWANFADVPPQVHGVWEFMSPSFRRGWYGPDRVCCEGMTEVQCVPLGRLLASFNISRVDLLSLDVEGAELDVLKTLDLATLRIAVILVELDGVNADKDALVRELLSSHGYCRDAVVAINEVWVACAASMVRVFCDGESRPQALF
eukprot:Amastigsp_a509617_36.p1 type:complete len:314 gc:universal Amastigsp_a509617_36:1996-1055(-)